MFLPGLGCTAPEPEPADAVASIAVLGDTQMMTEPAPPELAGRFAAETTWMQANAAALRLKFVLQLGDLTNGTYKEGGYTRPAVNPEGLTEMAYAKQAMDKLWRPASGPAIPWTISVGNHDVDEWCWGRLLDRRKVSRDRRCNPGGVIVDGNGTSRTTSNFTHAFPPSYFAAMPTWGGSASPSKVDDNFHRLTIGDQRWLVVSLMWAPQQADFDWANTVIDQEVAADPDVRVLFVTHGFMDPLWDGDPAHLTDGVALGNARTLYERVLRLHPQIRLVLSGHWASPRSRKLDGQCLDPARTASFSPCTWIRRATVDVPAADSRPAFTFHALLTDYSNNGDVRAYKPYVAPTEADLGHPRIAERSPTDNAFFRLLTIDSTKNTIRVRTITDPSNLRPDVPTPKGLRADVAGRPRPRGPGVREDRRRLRDRAGRLHPDLPVALAGPACGPAASSGRGLSRGTRPGGGGRSGARRSRGRPPRAAWPCA